MNKEEYIQHTAVLREAQLAAGEIGSGATFLGKANCGQVGYYHQAFFGLSVGIEHLCKLLYIADYAICHNGTYPNDKRMRKLGHDIGELLILCEEIATRVDSDRSYSNRPNSKIHRAIIIALTDFAKSTRYYNINYLTNPDVRQADPVAAWWKNVGTPILDKHYSDKARIKDEAMAAQMGGLLDGVASVFHTAETGEHINSVSEMMCRSGASDVLQRYGRLYTLQIVRWLVSIGRELSHTGGYEKQIAGLFCFHEPFVIYMNDDATFRSKTRWDPNRI